MSRAVVLTRRRFLGWSQAALAAVGATGLAYDPQDVGITPKQVQERPRAQPPRIELNPATGTTGQFGPRTNQNTIVVGTWMLLPGEADIVARRLHDVLSHPNA
jgi:L-seryl-tRNA(Ser) seleniumtransferase